MDAQIQKQYSTSTICNINRNTKGDGDGDNKEQQMKMVFWCDRPMIPEYKGSCETFEIANVFNNAMITNRFIDKDGEITDQEEIDRLARTYHIDVNARLPLYFFKLCAGRGIAIEFKVIGDPVVEADYNFYWINLVGNASYIVSNNIFTNIPNETSKFLLMNDITVVIDYSSENNVHLRDPVNGDGLFDNILPILHGQKWTYDLLNLDVVLLLSCAQPEIDKINQLFGDQNGSTRAVQLDCFIWESGFFNYRGNTNDYLLSTHKEGHQILSSIDPADRTHTNGKKILSLFGVAKPHRVLIYQHMVNTGIVERTNSSLFWNSYGPSHIVWMRDYIKHWINNHEPDWQLTLDTTHDIVFDTGGWNELGAVGDKYLHKDVIHNTIVNVTCESWDLHPIFTEKSLKCFQWGHIPLIFGGPGLIQKLKSYGFKFISEFDYHYDDDIMYEERILEFNKQIDKLNSWSDEDLIQLYKNNLELIEHNFRLIKDRIFTDLLEDLAMRITADKPDIPDDVRQCHFNMWEIK